MELTAGEQATLHFYEWERLLRGYYHFDTAVHLEPLYIPFRHKEPIRNSIDDGKVPSIFDSITNAFVSEQVEEKEPETEEQKLAYIYEPTTDLVGFSLNFPRGSEIQPMLFREWLSLISFTETPISFEIIGTDLSIQIQIVSHPSDSIRIQSQIRAYFPNIIIKPLEDIFDIGIDMYSEDVTIVDFGLSEEVMRPLQTSDNFQIDPLTSIIATMDRLEENEVAVFQILFQGVQTPWAMDMHYSVSDGQGGSFFNDSPEMPQLAKEKTNDPLFAIVMRIAVESATTERSEYLATECIQNISTVSSSRYNKLIPLDNKGYSYTQHLRNVFLRCTNRLGFLANTRELSHFLHYPNRTVISAKIGLKGGKTKKFNPLENEGILIGSNHHNGTDTSVKLNITARLSHTLVMGVTGVGKSTLLCNIALADIKEGRGCAVFDPHGDLCDDILKRIPKHRINDVIIIDPSDSEFPIGFNLLEAHSDAEKIVLSSDLVSSFKRYATAWGDNMTAVLQNAINTILESSNGGTLIELKRFLLEESFRKQFLVSVEDPSLHYYWNNEFPMVRKGIAPLLTRIDTFLRPKVLRYMLAQKSGIDFKAILEKQQIVLVKLSQGLIGEENSYLLGSLLLAKLNQVAMARQSQSKESRIPFNIICDEYQNFLTPSIEKMLSSSRKYGLGLTLANQELSQIDNPKLLNSVISNPFTRICFRLGDADAKRLESGFSFFEASDIQALGRGEAIARIGSSNYDFNMTTFPIADVSIDYSKEIINMNRQKYAKKRSDVEKILYSLLPKDNTTVSKKQIEKVSPVIQSEKTASHMDEAKEGKVSQIPLEQKQQILKTENEVKTIREHYQLQTLIKKIGQDHGYIATLEAPTPSGGKIDVLLKRDNSSIAFEISVHNTSEYELKNLKKCLAYKAQIVVMTSKKEKHLKAIEEKARKELSIKQLKKIKFIHPKEIPALLNSIAIFPEQKEERIKGFRVVTDIENSTRFDPKALKSHIAKKLFGKNR